LGDSGATSYGLLHHRLPRAPLTSFLSRNYFLSFPQVDIISFTLTKASEYQESLRYRCVIPRFVVITALRSGKRYHLVNIEKRIQERSMK
jgi:hypothetical protein